MELKLALQCGGPDVNRRHDGGDANIMIDQAILLCQSNRDALMKEQWKSAFSHAKVNMQELEPVKPGDSISPSVKWFVIVKTLNVKLN